MAAANMRIFVVSRIAESWLKVPGYWLCLSLHPAAAVWSVIIVRLMRCCGGGGAAGGLFAVPPRTPNHHHRRRYDKENQKYTSILIAPCSTDLSERCRL